MRKKGNGPPCALLPAPVLKAHSPGVQVATLTPPESVGCRAWGGRAMGAFNWEPTEFGVRLRALREARGSSQIALGKMVGYCHHSLSRMERADRSHTGRWC